jgi:membrane protease YdiL (CAAX protease family)
MVAWAATLAASLLPNILLQETTGSAPGWLLWGKLALMALLIAGTFVWQAIRPLRGLFAIFAVFLLASFAASLLVTIPQWRSWVSGATFTADMLETQLLKLFVALVMIAALFLIKRRRSAFFLVKGQLNAPAEPVRWLGIDKPISWSRLGPIAALCIALGTLVFLLLGGAPPSDNIAQALPLLPVILIFAAFNAFSEQVSYRAALLATSHDVVGKSHALLLVAANFGVAHFYGVPYGVIGVVMAGFLGWFLAKAMLETRGFVMPWFIHFCQDVLIFSFIAIGSVTPGG